MNTSLLITKDLSVNVEEKEILHNDFEDVII